MNPTSRCKEIKIRLSDDEYQKLMELKTEPRLASWIRNVALNQKMPRKQKNNIAPELLYELNKIGVNINQIARVVNKMPRKEWTVSHAIQLIAILTDMDLTLKEILNNNASKNI